MASGLRWTTTIGCLLELDRAAAVVMGHESESLGIFMVVAGNETKSVWEVRKWEEGGNETKWNERVSFFV